ncbi:flippase [bacterium]|nr:flippase [bacterium]MBU1435291.1 flippase [bacterium]MBU1503489.1 flippase [bacterium]
MIKKLKSLKNHEGFMKYFKNTSWLFGEKILRMVVGLFVGIWVARYLGPEQFGLFSYAQSFVGLFTAIATLGLDGIVVRELVKDESRRDELIGTAFWLKLMGAFLVLAVLALAVNFTSNDTYTNTLVFIIASATIFQSFNVIDFYFQSKVLSRYVVFANIITLFLSSIAKIVLILYNAPLIAFAWVILFDSFILACGFVYFYFKNHLTNRVKIFKFNRATAINLLRDSWPLIISGMAIMIYARIDQVMLKEMVDAGEVGQYAVAIRTIEAFDFLSVIIISSLAPAVTNAKKISEELFYQRLTAIYKLMMIIFVIIFIPILIFGEQIIVILYGNEYQVASQLFIISAFRTLFTNFGVANSLFIANNNLFKYSMYFTIFGAMLNILLNLYFIPIYYAYGALMATLISFTVTIFILNFFFSKLRFNGLLMIRALFNFYTLKLKDLK